MRRFVSVGTCCIRVSSLVPHCRELELELDPVPSPAVESRIRCSHAECGATAPVRAHCPLIPVAYFRAAHVKCCAFTCSHAAFTCSHAGRCSPYFFDLYAFAVNACSPAYDQGFDALARFHVLPITATPST